MSILRSCLEIWLPRLEPVDTVWVLDAVDRVQAGQDPTKVYTAKGSQNPPSLLPVIPGTRFIA